MDRGDGLTVADLPGLPVTVKQDLWDGYPFGMLAVPRAASGGGARLQRHGRPAHPGRLHARRPAAVGPDVRAGAGLRRRHRRQPGAQRLRLRPVHRRPRPAPGRDRTRRHRGPGLRRDDLPAGHADPRPAARHPHLHAVLRAAPGRGAAGSGWRPRASLQAGLFGAEPWTDEMRGPHRATCSACARWTSTGCPRSSAPAWPPSAGGRRRPARQRGPFHRRGDRPGHRRTRCPTAPRASWCSPR